MAENGLVLVEMYPFAIVKQGNNVLSKKLFNTPRYAHLLKYINMCVEENVCIAN
jgi:hypothetical protein